jgi:hypothetical protein
MLLFDKAERYAIIHIMDNLVFTELQVSVMPRVDAGLAAPDAPDAPDAPEAPPALPVWSGPAESFDPQPLSE